MITSSSPGFRFYSDKVYYKNKHLCKISFPNDTWFLTYLKLNFDGLSTPQFLSTENAWAFTYNFFAVTIANNLFDNLIGTDVVNIKCVNNISC